MILVLIMAAAIWFGGRFMGAPRDVRLILLGLLYVAVLGIQVALPEGTPLRENTGGSAALWLILGGFVALILAYRHLLGRLRQRAGEATYEGSFIAHWMGELLYWDWPGWVFGALYTGFGALVLASWFLVKPRRQAGKR